MVAGGGKVGQNSLNALHRAPCEDLDKDLKVSY